MSHPSSCEIVVPVHNALHATRDCLRSVLAHTHYRPLSLVIVDDGSDHHVRRELAALAGAFKEFPCELIRHESARGFVHSCNEALSRSKADHVILLNSDTIVTPGWLEGMVACAESQPRVAIVSPMSNRASFHSLPIPPGYNLFEFSEAIALKSTRRYPDLVTASGFCILFTRAALDTFGVFDEIYSPGYGEESDYCMRALAEGWKILGADDAFVYHRGSSSFTELRNELAARHHKIFMKRWKNPYESALAKYKKEGVLDEIRSLFPQRPRLKKLRVDNGLASNSAPVWRDLVARGGLGYLTFHAVGAAFNRLGQQMEKVSPIEPVGLRLRSVGSEVKDWTAAHLNRPQTPTHQALNLASRPVRSYHRIRKDLLKKKPPLAPKTWVKPRGLRVTYVLPKFKVGGGTTSVVQLINRLTLKGVDAKIATTLESNQSAMDGMTLYAEPYIFDTTEDLVRYLPPADLVVATFWTTADPVARISERQGIASAYFIQGFEADFYPPDDIENRRGVLASYDRIANKIVKTQWLQRQLQNLGHEATIVPLGLNTDLFYPRDVKPGSRPRVLAMCKRDSAHQDIPHLFAALSKLKKANDAIEIVLFGSDDLSGLRIPFAYTNQGVVHGDALSRLYSSADVFVDCSLVQGFGRPGLEAMACGCAAVLSDRGGVVGYARDEHNSLLGDPCDPDGVVARVQRLLRSPELRARLVRRGLETATRFSYETEADRTLTLFRAWSQPTRTRRKKIKTALTHDRARTTN